MLKLCCLLCKTLIIVLTVVSVRQFLDDLSKRKQSPLLFTFFSKSIKTVDYCN